MICICGVTKLPTGLGVHSTADAIGHTQPALVLSACPWEACSYSFFSFFDSSGNAETLCQPPSYAAALAQTPKHGDAEMRREVGGQRLAQSSACRVLNLASPCSNLNKWPKQRRPLEI